MIKIKVHKIIFISFAIILLLVILFFFSRINFIFLNQYEKFFFENTNLQGIECIDGKAIILEESGEVFEVVDDSLVPLTSLKRPLASTIKNINTLVHSNSLLVLKNQTAFASNSSTRLPAKIVSFNYERLIKDRHLSEDNIIDIQSDPKVNSIHLEKININSKEFIIKAYRDTKNNFNFTLNNNSITNELCKITISEKNIQNLFWEKNNNLFHVIKNPIKNRGGQINSYKLVNDSNLICPQPFNEEYTIYLTYDELEGYISCNNKEYILFIRDKDSIIYSRDLTEY